jgi:hypothetical protein
MKLSASEVPVDAAQHTLKESGTIIGRTAGEKSPVAV